MSDLKMNWEAFFDEMRKMANCMHETGEKMEAARASGRYVETWRLASVSTVEGLCSAIADAGKVALGLEEPLEEAAITEPSDDQVREALENVLGNIFASDRPKPN